MIAELPKYLYVKSYFSLPSIYIEFSFFVLLLCIIVLKSLVLIKKNFFKSFVTFALKEFFFVFEIILGHFSQVCPFNVQS